LATKELAVASRQREFLTTNSMTVAPHPPYTPLFPRLKIKLKCRHFDITEVIEAELQAVLNTLAEHDSRMHLKKWQKRWERCIRAQGYYFEGDGGQGAQN
jgi:hypothetical protein